ncbi:F0F1 ATP synthase subunit B family protein [Acidomonas methanolica]|uniref:F0F1 ATP synthase subunit B family protein n=1 Tax=Acidomonas methanolica TaxID=437 RepID=UPI002119C380|nr:hypothetical protein [Acidomonas methanolica]MCQ9155849.1 hypothetical protein [Acidomonas methanolica]
MPASPRKPAAPLTALRAFGPVLGLTPGVACAETMPQLDFGNPYLLWQVVWGAVIFVVFYVILSRSALPRVASVLAARRQCIEGDLEVAHRARDEADRAVDELRRARHDAAAQAQANIDQVVQEARRAAERQAHEMNQRLAVDIAKAEERITASRREALARLPEIATEIARPLASKLLAPAGTQVGDETLSAAVRTSLSKAA